MGEYFFQETSLDLRKHLFSFLMKILVTECLRTLSESVGINWTNKISHKLDSHNHVTNFIVLVNFTILVWGLCSSV